LTGASVLVDKKKSDYFVRALEDDTRKKNETPAKPPATMFPKMQRLKYAMELTLGLNSRIACANLRP
jgi:hypothetical protein